MATKIKLDTIEVDGQVYEFTDQTARDGVTNVNTRLTNLNNTQTQNLAAEVTRAKGAEQALEDGKVSKEAGKGLSTNDFTDTYKGMLDSPAAMTGATALTDGKQGDVPKPVAGEENKYLRGDGAWETPHDTTYDDATQSVHGLMSAADKTKLDAMDQETDDVQACETEFTGNKIIQTFGNGKVRTTTFNNDGTISEKIEKTGMTTINLTTTFNNDGSISRTRS